MPNKPPRPPQPVVVANMELLLNELSPERADELRVEYGNWGISPMTIDLSMLSLVSSAIVASTMGKEFENLVRQHTAQRYKKNGHVLSEFGFQLVQVLNHFHFTGGNERECRLVVTNALMRCGAYLAKRVRAPDRAVRQLEYQHGASWLRPEPIDWDSVYGEAVVPGMRQSSDNTQYILANHPRILRRPEVQIRPNQRMRVKHVLSPVAFAGDRILVGRWEAEFLDNGVFVGWRGRYGDDTSIPSVFLARCVRALFMGAHTVAAPLRAWAIAVLKTHDARRQGVLQAHPLAHPGLTPRPERLTSPERRPAAVALRRAERDRRAHVLDGLAFSMQLNPVTGEPENAQAVLEYIRGNDGPVWSNGHMARSMGMALSQQPVKLGHNLGSSFGLGPLPASEAKMLSIELLRLDTEFEYDYVSAAFTSAVNPCIKASGELVQPRQTMSMSRVMVTEADLARGTELAPGFHMASPTFQEGAFEEVRRRFALERSHLGLRIMPFERFPPSPVVRGCPNWVFETRVQEFKVVPPDALDVVPGVVGTSLGAPPAVNALAVGKAALAKLRKFNKKLKSGALTGGIAVSSRSNLPAYVPAYNSDVELEVKLGVHYKLGEGVQLTRLLAEVLFTRNTTIEHIRTIQQLVMNQDGWLFDKEGKTYVRDMRTLKLLFETALPYVLPLAREQVVMVDVMSQRVAQAAGLKELDGPTIASSNTKISMAFYRNHAGDVVLEAPHWTVMGDTGLQVTSLPPEGDPMYGRWAQQAINMEKRGGFAGPHRRP